MKIQRLWSSTLFLMLAVVGPAFAQRGDLKVKVPFAFNVAEGRLPAGEYVLCSGSGKVIIRDSQSRTLVLALANGSSRKTADTIGRAIFECYGDQCFLAQVWATGQSDGNQLLRSSSETKIAAKQAGQYFAVLGTRPQR